MAMSIQNALRWIIAAPLGFLCVLIVAGNYAGLVAAFQTRKSVSLIPVVGGLFAAMALVVCPLGDSWRYAWLPLVLDPACLFILIMLTVHFLGSYRR